MIGALEAATMPCEMRCDKNSTWPKLMRQKNQIDCGDDLTFHKLCPLTCVPSRVIPSGVSQGFLIRTIPYKKDPFSCCKFTDAKGGGFLIGRPPICSGLFRENLKKVFESSLANKKAPC